MEDNKHAGSGHVVHDTVVLLNSTGALGWRYDHVLLSQCEVACQHLADVHELLLGWTGLGVGVTGRVASVDGEVCAIAVTRS